MLGSGGVNCDPPNRADQLNPPRWELPPSLHLARGALPPRPRHSRLRPVGVNYVDPATGQATSIIVVPASQSLSWKDGDAPLGLSDFAALNFSNPPTCPTLIVLADDDDNAWGGGYSYYREATPNLVSQATRRGLRAHRDRANTRPIIPSPPTRLCMSSRVLGSTPTVTSVPSVPELELAAATRLRADRHRERLARGHPQLGGDYRGSKPP